MSEKNGSEEKGCAWIVFAFFLGLSILLLTFTFYKMKVG